MSEYHAKVMKAGEENDKKNTKSNLKIFYLRKQYHEKEQAHKKVVEALKVLKLMSPISMLKRSRSLRLLTLESWSK